MTYGHALYEFCLYRQRTRAFVAHRLPKIKLLGKLDLFSNMAIAIGRRTKKRLPYSAQFFMEQEQKADNKHFQLQVE